MRKQQHNPNLTEEDKDRIVAAHNPKPQTMEYNCGPTALHYFLSLHGRSDTLEELQFVLDPTPELGTDPKVIEEYLTQCGLLYEINHKFYRCYLPILVNYNYENEGDHYGVITAIDDDKNITLWNPYTAELNYWSHEAFKQVHYSPLKKLKQWSLYLT